MKIKNILENEKFIKVFDFTIIALAVAIAFMEGRKFQIARDKEAIENIELKFKKLAESYVEVKDEYEDYKEHSYVFKYNTETEDKCK